MGRERMVNEDKQAMGKRAKQVAAAFKRSKPPNAARQAYRDQKSQWEADVLAVLEEFEATNKYFPSKYFLSLCGFEGSPI